MTGEVTYLPIQCQRHTEYRLKFIVWAKVWAVITGIFKETFIDDMQHYKVILHILIFLI